MEEASKITSKVVSKVVSKTKDSAQEKATALAKERARKLKKKGTGVGGEKIREEYKKFGFFGYFFLGIEAFIIISLFALKDFVDIIDTATIVAAGAGEAAGETISTILGLILGIIVFGWLWFRFGRSKKGSEAAKKAALQGVKILGSFVGVWIADIIPVIEKMPWLTLYGLCLYGLEFYKMATQPESAPVAQEEGEGGSPPSPKQSSLRAQLQQKTQQDDA